MKTYLNICQSSDSAIFGLRSSYLNIRAFYTYYVSLYENGQLIFRNESGEQYSLLFRDRRPYALIHRTASTVLQLTDLTAFFAILRKADYAVELHPICREQIELVAKVLFSVIRFEQLSSEYVLLEKLVGRFQSDCLSGGICAEIPEKNERYFVMFENGDMRPIFPSCAFRESTSSVVAFDELQHFIAQSTSALLTVFRFDLNPFETQEIIDSEVDTTLEDDSRAEEITEAAIELLQVFKNICARPARLYQRGNEVLVTRLQETSRKFPVMAGLLRCFELKGAEVTPTDVRVTSPLLFGLFTAVQNALRDIDKLNVAAKDVEAWEADNRHLLHVLSRQRTV